jgi:hypothetical protein
MKLASVLFSVSLCATVIAGGWILLPVAPLVPSLSDSQKAERNQFLTEAETKFPPMPVVASVPTSSVAQVAGQLQPNERVIGLTINGEARAYPLNFINTPGRKVMNDELGGEPVVITWCDLCHTAAVFSRKIGGQVETFACTGMLWHGMLVMHDVRTESFWNPLVGKALAGVRSGASLEPIDVAMTSWHQWSATHPNTTVVVGDRVQSDLTTNFYSAPNATGEWVFGVKESDGSRAWTLDYLRAHPVIETEIDGRPAVVMYHSPSVTARLYSASVEGQTLSFQTSNGSVIDQQSSSQWNILSGRAIAGPLAGKSLTPIPAVWAFEKFWQDLLPGAAIERATVDATTTAADAGG